MSAAASEQPRVFDGDVSTRAHPVVVGGVVFVVALVWWPMVLLGGAAVAGARRAVPIVRDRQRRQLKLEALPEVVDLIVIAVSSGETIRGALRIVAVEGPPSVRPGFLAALDHLRAGGAFADGLLRATELLGSDYRSVMVTLSQAEREGSPLGALLIRLADEASAARRRRTELAARRLPVQMLVPLVSCSLPAVIVGAVVPLLIVSLRRL